MSKRITSQSKNYFSMENNMNPKHFPKVQPRNQNQKRQEKTERGNYRSLQENQLNGLSGEKGDGDLNRLDLIFKKEPRDIQQKLMKLLIAYNAVMRYNKQTDMFEVDLLLPFLSEQQKRHFIRQFLEVRQQKKNYEFEFKGEKNHAQELSSENEDIYSSKQFKKFSFNARQNRPFDEQQSEASLFDNHLQAQSPEQGPNQTQLHNYNEILGQVTAQFNHQIVEKQKQNQDIYDDSLRYEQIDSMIAKRLKMAIKKIQSRKERGKENEFAKMSSDDYSKQEESIIDQISNPSFNNTQNISDSKQQLTFSEYIKQDQSQSSPNGDTPHNQHNQEQNYTSLRKPYMQIDQEPEEEDYEPLFQKKQYTHKNAAKDEKNKMLTSFEDYTKQLAYKNDRKKANKIKPSGPIQTKSKKNEVVTAKAYQSTRLNASENNRIKQTKNWEGKDKKIINSAKFQNKRANIINPPQNRERVFSSHSQSNQKKSKESPISKDSKKLKNQLQEFLEGHKKKLSKIYYEIKQRINDRYYQGSSQHQMSQKELEKFYILVQDDLQETDRDLQQITEESQKSQFKQQMLKHYHNQILVNNRNLSSEELVKYFKFLHSNAKKLYIKYLQNKDK